MIDTDGSGFLSYEQIKNMFSGLDEQGEKKLKEILSQVDTDQDQNISLNEFREMLLLFLK